MQGEILQISSNGELVIVKNSAHYMQNDEPEVVVSAIKKLIDIVGLLFVLVKMPLLELGFISLPIPSTN